MTEENKASVMVSAILEYLYDNASGKITVAEAVGILEIAKLQLVTDQTEE